MSSDDRLAIPGGRPPRVLFFGSRRWPSLTDLHELMWPRVAALPLGATVVEGDALGADRAARFLVGELAQGRDWRGDVAGGARHDVAVVSVPPLGRGIDRARFHRRNVAMAALLDGPNDRAEGFLSCEAHRWTAGSADMAGILRRARIPFTTHWLDGTRSVEGPLFAGGRGA
jgi:hypothetical protein